MAEEPVEAFGDLVTGQPRRDEDEPGMPVVVGLRLQVDRGIHQVLYPMNDERLAGRRGVELAFHAQDTVATEVKERRPPDGESGTVDIANPRPTAGDRKSGGEGKR